MSDSLSEADKVSWIRPLLRKSCEVSLVKIRNKRLAKLGSQAPAQSSVTGEGRGDGSTASPQPKAPVQPVANPEQSAPKINITNLAENHNSRENSLIQLETRQNKEGAPRTNPDNTSERPMTPTKRPNSVSRRPASRTGETLEEWENRVLSGIFRMSVDPSVKIDAHGHTLYFVKGVREELQEQGGPIKLSTNVLEQAIVEVGSDSGKTKPLDYLLGCWKRVSRQLRSYRGQKIDEAKVDIVKEARRLCMSYCIFAVTIPDMFGQEQSATSPLTPHLLLDPEDDRGLCHDFLIEAISRFPEDDSVQPALIGAVEDMSRQLAKMTMNNDEYKLYVGALRNLVRYPALVKAIAQSPLFLPPSASAADLEATTLLGPFFAISPLQREATMNYFSSPKTRDQSSIETTQRTLRMALSAHQQDILDIVNHIIKADKESRERMLDWFALCVNKNHKRRAMQVDQKLVSSDGFMINLTICLDQLCEPFMDAQFTKIDRIDVDYLRRKPRVDIKEETKLNADQSTSDEFFSQSADGQSNFISEIFFLTLAAHHYGSEAASNKMSQLEKDLKRMEKHIEEIELDRHKFLDDPLRLRMFENAVQKYKDQIDKGLSYKHAVQGVLLDEQNQQRTMQFMRYVIVWLLRLVAPTSQYPKEPLRLPLPLGQPEVFKCLPEYFLEDVVGAYRFVMQNMPLNIFSTQSDELVMLCITFLRSSEYIKNPYLKAGLVTIMYHGIWPFRNRSKGVLGDLLTSLDIATEHLLHALMKFYIEVENTGAHTQFYDKFNIRFEIFQIIKCIWSNTMYREQLDRESKVNVDFFVRFVNLLLNDVTFVLDESLSAFQQIHSLSNELKTSNGMEQAIRTEKEEALSAAQGKAKSYMQLTNETVAMLKLFTEALADSFTMPEIVQRLADMLDYNLDVLVGPKRKDLVVENPKEYGFQPGVLLGEIVDVYLNLGRKESFVLAVARDGRSYKPANFEEARRILATKLSRSTREVDAWISLFQRFKKAKEADDQAEEDLGEIPDEFLDPLVFTLMEDPVILPTSKTTIDRSTIRSHLLSDPNDPFNRSPLKIEDVIPDTELKEKIEAFKAEKRGAKTLAAAETSSMGISPG
ncbi:MAG: hypothetical protein Q9214_001541 [Letrouitia sp. 1 TL-2023]